MKIIVAALALFFSSFVSAVTLDKIVVFGDSLSDTGNLYEYMKHQMPISPPYYQGRFTNGPVWVELLLQHYYQDKMNEHLLDYAFGGAGVASENSDDDDALFTLGHEVDSYLLAHQDKADDHTLYVVWIGCNNYLALPDDVEQTIKEVNWGIKTNIERLISKGARHFLVVNLPDLGKTPTARDFDAIDLLSFSSLQHNEALSQNIEKLRQAYPAVQWIFFDTNQVLNEILLDPVHYGFTNITDTCYEAVVDEHPSAKSILNMVATVKTPLAKDACDGFLFFDPVHPSEPAHQIMADRLIALFKQLEVKFI